MQIYLVQHGLAKAKDGDPARPLTSDGAGEVVRVAAFCKSFGLSLDAIWHSDKLRARQTAQIFADALSPKRGLMQRNDLAPKDPVKPICKAVESENADVMIVGHLPFLSCLAGLLLTSDEGAEPVAFRNAGVVCLQRREEADTWQVAWYVRPELLAADAV